MKSSVNTVVTVDRASWHPVGEWGSTWIASWTTPMGHGGAVFAVVDDFGNLVQVGR